MSETTTATTVTTATNPDFVKAAETAADWWASRLAPNAGLKFDNGDDSFGGAFAAMTALMNARDTGNPDAEVIAKFRDGLRDHCLGLLNRGCEWITYDVDYGPDYNLGQILIAAGVGKFSELLPWKTMMWISPRKVSVSMGYRAEAVTLWQAETAAESEAAS